MTLTQVLMWLLSGTTLIAAASVMTQIAIVVVADWRADRSSRRSGRY